jgi:hypothetical protein
MRMTVLFMFLVLCPAWIRAADAPANTWVEVKLDAQMPERIAAEKGARWETGDGYSDTIYRAKSGTVIIRTGIHCEALGYTPSYYTNTSVEWNLKTDAAPAIDVSNWSGGAGGGGKLLPAFKEHPTPSPRHTYDGICYVDAEDAMYMVQGANWKIVLGNNVSDEAKAAMVKDNQSTWKYSFADNRWTQIEGGVSSAGYKGAPYENHLQYWPAGKKLLFIGDNDFYAEFDLATQKWAMATLKNKPPSSLYNARSCWDSKRSLWVFRLGPKVCVLDPQTKEFKALPDAYTVDDPKKDPRAALKGVTYISKHDLYLINGETAEDTWVFDPNKNAWSQVKCAGPKLVNGYLQYDPLTDTVALSYQLQAFTLKFVP